MSYLLAEPSMAATVGGPGWQVRSTDATISLPLAQGMAYLVPPDQRDK